MIIGIAPGTGDEVAPQVRPVLEEAPVCLAVSGTLGSAFEVDVLELYSRSLYTRIWTVGVGLFNKEGELLEMVSSVEDKDNTFTLNGWYGFRKRTVDCVIPSYYSDGDYVLRVMTRQKGYDEWVLPDVVGGDSRNRIPVCVDSGTIRFNEVSTSVEEVTGCRDEVLSHQYFDLNGRCVISPVKGQAVIEVVTWSSGKQTTLKHIFR